MSFVIIFIYNYCGNTVQVRSNGDIWGLEFWDKQTQISMYAVDTRFSQDVMNLFAFFLNFWNFFTLKKCV